MGRRESTQLRRAALLPRIGSHNVATVYDRSGGICHLCHHRVPRHEASRDHLMPLVTGGSSRMANLAIAHRMCNESRGDLPIHLARRSYHDLERHTREAFGRPPTSREVQVALAAEFRTFRDGQQYAVG